MFKPISIYKLRNSEFLNLGKGIIKLTKDADPASLGLADALVPFEAEWFSLDDLFGLQKGSVLTNDVEQLDKRRDDAVSGIRMLAESYTRHFDESYKAAAELVLNIFNNHGKAVQSLNYQAQTEAVRSLVEDFETNPNVVSAIAQLQATAWVTELNAANEAFDTMYLERTKETSTKPGQSLSNRRRQAVEVLNTFLATVEATQRIMPKPGLPELIAQINTLFDEYNQLLATRAGRRGSNPEA